MDMLDKHLKKLDALDKRMIRLFEMRMDIVRKMTEYRERHGLRPDNKTCGRDVAEKVTASACDIDTIAYTEGLLMYLATVAKKYQRKLTRKNR